ncbi:MAG: PQQ-binding-like beta-propeller repeat protein [Acidobacteriota bacterium]
MKKFSVLLFLLLLITGCTGINKIPEISPDLSLNKLIINTNLNKVHAAKEFDDKVFLFNRKGRIYQYDPEKESTKLILNLKNDLSEVVSFFNNFAILKREDKNSYIIFDLKDQRKLKIPRLTTLEKIHGISTDIIIYQNKSVLTIYNYNLKKVLKEIKYKKLKIFNVKFEENIIYILGKKILYVFNILNNHLDETKLNSAISSPFTKSGDYIYFGAEKRKLVKFSLKRKKILWERILPLKLIHKPVVAGNLISVTPEDNNIYFFTKRGGLKWWKKFDSIPAAPPVKMEDNIAVLLRSEEKGIIKFYNPKKKREQVFIEEDMIFFKSPFFYKGYIYLFSKRPDTNEINFINIGNKFGAEIKISPKEEFSIGKSIKFFITPVNIKTPDISIFIKSEDNNVVFKKDFKKNKTPSFAWIPEKKGDYILSINIKGENGPSLNEKKEIKVVDFEKIYLDYFYLIQKNCKKPEIEKREKIEKD